MKQSWRQPRLTAIGFLGQRDDRLSKQLIQSAIQDKDPAVRMAAEIELKKQALTDMLRGEQD